MPHGAGHVGGHHHHHHGGFHHHHHHHFGHHHSRGWYWGGPVYHRYGYGYRRRGISCMIAVILIVIVVIPLSVALGLRYGAVSADVDNLNQYTLTDKVLLDYSNVFCQGLSAQSMSIQSSNATLYMLSSSPSLADVERFNLSESGSFDSEGDYEQWNFYLNEGSNVSLNVCYTASNPTAYSYISFYLIRGDRNFTHWKNNEVSSYSILYRSLISQCQTINHSVFSNDRFYFAFYSDIFEYASLSIDFRFERAVYRVNPSDVVENCTIPLDAYSSCSVDIPLSASYTALLSLNTSPPVDYGDEGIVYIDCQPRIWIYAVIAVSVIIAAAAILTCFIVCVCVLVKRNKKKYTPLQGGGDNTVAREAYEDGANPPVVNVTAGDAAGIPPPYNPQYPTAAGVGYGATTTAPGSTQYTHVYAQ